VSKKLTGSLLVVTLLLLSGCDKKAAAPAPEPAAPHPQPTVAYTAVDTTGLNKAEGGKSVAELFAEKDQLAGKTVSVRGKVVKVLANTMDRNWVHLRDGTGADKTNDLTVTTKDPLPGVGATVLVTGTLAKDKNLGLGYQYSVLLEDAKVTTEVAAPHVDSER
jgi:hypothetical protein